MSLFYCRQILAWIFLIGWLILYGKTSCSRKSGKMGDHSGYTCGGIGYFLLSHLPEPIRTYRWPLKKNFLVIIDGQAKGEAALLYRECRKMHDLYLLAGWVSPSILFPSLFPLLLALSIGRWFYEDHFLSKKAKEIQDEVIQSLPEMLSRLLLSIQAGSLVQDAWTETGLSQEGILYEEMREQAVLVKQGVSLTESYRSFGRHFQLPVLGEIGQLMVEGLHLGTQQLVKELETIRSRQVQAARRRMMEEAERASQQMIFPSILLFIGILILVMAPMLAQGLV